MIYISHISLFIYLVSSTKRKEIEDYNFNAKCRFKNDENLKSTNILQFNNNTDFINGDEGNKMFDDIFPISEYENIFNDILNDVYIDQINNDNEEERLNQILKLDLKHSMNFYDNIMFSNDININEHNLETSCKINTNINTISKDKKEEKLIKFDQKHILHDNQCYNYNKKLEVNKCDSSEQNIKDFDKNNFCRISLKDYHIEWINQNFIFYKNVEKKHILSFNCGFAFYNQLIDSFFVESFIIQKSKKYFCNNDTKQKISIVDLFCKKIFILNFEKMQPLLKLEDKYLLKENELENNTNLNKELLQSNEFEQNYICNSDMFNKDSLICSKSNENLKSIFDFDEQVFLNYFFDVKKVDIESFFKQSKNLLGILYRSNIDIFNKDFIKYFLEEIKEIKFVIDRVNFVILFFRILTINYNIRRFLSRLILLVKIFKHEKISVFDKKTLDKYINIWFYMIFFSKSKIDSKILEIYIHFEKKLKSIIFHSNQSNFFEEIIKHFVYTITFFQKSYAEITLNFTQQKFLSKVLEDTETINESNFFLNFVLKIIIDNNLLDDFDNSTLTKC